MARVTGPLHSDTASGTLGKAITFSHWKGRPYVRERVIPKNPNAAKQLGVRAMMRFLSQAWAAIKVADATYYHAEAKAKNISDFNQYISANLLRWQNWQAPTKVWPATESSSAQTITTLTPTGGAGQVNIAAAWTTNAHDWGVAIMRDSASITVFDWTKVVAILPPTSAGVLTYIDAPLKAGTYYYSAVILNDDGKMGTPHASSSAITVT